MTALPVLLFCALFLSACAPEKENESSRPEHAGTVSEALLLSLGPSPRLEESSLMEYAEACVAIGPRFSGSPGAKQTAEWILGMLRRHPAIQSSRMEFEAATPAGRVRFCNIVAELNATGAAAEKPGAFVIVGAHYDTKHFLSASAFQGANDGASGVAALLGMIDALAKLPERPVGLRFVFFDGEEALYSYGDADGLHGSRHVASVWAENGDLARCRGMILLDMIGDRDLTVTIPADTPDLMKRLLFDSAKALGHSAHFTVYEHPMIDDHLPFQEKGVPSIDLIDFRYGPDHSYWHTGRDTLDKISAKSMKIAGDIAFAMIWRLAALERGRETAN